MLKIQDNQQSFFWAEQVRWQYELLLKLLLVFTCVNSFFLASIMLYVQKTFFE